MTKSTWIITAAGALGTKCKTIWTEKTFTVFGQIIKRK
jgi:hypothetical protein